MRSVHGNVAVYRRVRVGEGRTLWCDAKMSREISPGGEVSAPSAARIARLHNHMHVQAAAF